MLREFYSITTSLPSNNCSPLNAISLPSSQRNLYVACHFGSMASHEVTQTHIPSHYGTTFTVPNTKPHTEWSLIGGKGAISPFHINTEGLATVVVLLKGFKYWILATPIREDDNLCSAGSLGPNWDPYILNVGDNANLFHFEAVHLQKGDML